MSMPVTLNGVVYHKLFYLVTLLVNLRVLDSSREWPCPFIEITFGTVVKIVKMVL